MNFIYPGFLYAIGLISIPILIHLFNFQKAKTVYFSQVKLLKEVKQSTNSNARIRHWLILLMRCLIIVSLAFAFSQPYIRDKELSDVNSKQYISIYIDNSFSMQRNSTEGDLLSVAKRKALFILDSYKESDKFNLISNNYTSTSHRWLNKAQLIKEIQQINIGSSSKKFSEVISRQNELNKEGIKIKRYFISDLQSSFFDFKNLNIDTFQVSLIPIISSDFDNMFLDSLFLTSPIHLTKMNEELIGTVKSNSQLDIKELPCRLYLNDKLKSPGLIQFKESDSVGFSIRFRSDENSIQNGVLSIDDYPITYDDTLYFNYRLSSNLSILHLYQDFPNKGLKTLYSNDSLFSYQTSPIRSIDYSVLNNTALLILDEISEITSGTAEELVKYYSSGGAICIIPSNKMKADNFNSFLRRLKVDEYVDTLKGEFQIVELQKEDDLFYSVFESLPKQLMLPSVSKFWKTTHQQSLNGVSLLKFRNGDGFLNHYNIGNGNLYIFNGSLRPSNTNFTNHAILVPIFYNMALLSKRTNKLYYFMDQPEIILPGVSPSETPIKIRKGKFELIPAQEYHNGSLVLDLSLNLMEPGHYDIIRNDSIIEVISLNYTRNESNINSIDTEVLKSELESFGIRLDVLHGDEKVLKQEIVRNEFGTHLWKYFIILALLFLTIEQIILRVYKK